MRFVRCVLLDPWLLTTTPLLSNVASAFFFADTFDYMLLLSSKFIHKFKMASRKRGAQASTVEKCRAALDSINGPAINRMLSPVGAFQRMVDSDQHFAGLAHMNNAELYQVFGSADRRVDYNTVRKSGRLMCCIPFGVGEFRFIADKLNLVYTRDRPDEASNGFMAAALVRYQLPQWFQHFCLHFVSGLDELWTGDFRDYCRSYRYMRYGWSREEGVELPFDAVTPWFKFDIPPAHVGNSQAIVDTIAICVDYAMARFETLVKCDKVFAAFPFEVIRCLVRLFLVMDFMTYQQFRGEVTMDLLSQYASTFPEIDITLHRSLLFAFIAPPGDGYVDPLVQLRNHSSAQLRGAAESMSIWRDGPYRRRLSLFQQQMRIVAKEISERQAILRRVERQRRVDDISAQAGFPDIDLLGIVTSLDFDRPSPDGGPAPKRVAAGDQTVDEMAEDFFREIAGAGAVLDIPVGTPPEVLPVPPPFPDLPPPTLPVLPPLRVVPAEVVADVPAASSKRVKFTHERSVPDRVTATTYLAANLARIRFNNAEDRRRARLREATLADAQLAAVMRNSANALFAAERGLSTPPVEDIPVALPGSNYFDDPGLAPVGDIVDLVGAVPLLSEVNEVARLPPVRQRIRDPAAVAVIRQLATNHEAVLTLMPRCLATIRAHCGIVWAMFCLA